MEYWRGGFGGIGYSVPSLTSSVFGLEVQEEGRWFSGIAMMKWYLILDTRLIDDDDDDSITIMMMALHAHSDSVFKAVHKRKKSTSNVWILIAAGSRFTLLYFT